MKKPIINIKYGKLIDPFFKDSVSLNYPNYTISSIDTVQDKVRLFKDIWKKEGDKFIYEMSKLGLEFKRNVIDCFIVTATPRDMSAPLIIRSRYNPIEFLDIMYHELLHILFSDNEIPKYSVSKDISNTTVNHIELFAVLTYFYLDILEDEVRLNKVKEKSNDVKNIDYKKAWNIVESIGYKKIIKDLRDKKKILPKDLIRSI